MTDGRRLTRSRNKQIAGVCAGIAEYFGWEVTLFRVVFVVVSVLSVAFPGILVYVVLWIVMPPPDPHEPATA
jgi:phage shock protein C